MRNVLQPFIFAIALLPTFAGHAEAADEYSLVALRGARTMWFNFTEIGDAKCDYQHNLREKALPMLLELKQLGLEVRDEIPSIIGTPPDLAVLVTVEATSSKGTSPEMDCAIFVKLEALHSMLGTLRYQSSPIALTAIAYRSFRYGVAPRDEVGNRLHETALHAIAVFANAYFLANPR